MKDQALRQVYNPASAVDYCDGRDLLLVSVTGPIRPVNRGQSLVADLPVWLKWHGRLMVAAWVVLLPLGILIARYFKITPRQKWPAQLDNRFWWHSHLGLQYSGVAVMFGGFLIAATHVRWESQRIPVHGWLGLSVIALALLQVFSGLLRGTKGGPAGGPGGTSQAAVPGDHYEMTRRRIIFEYVHKNGGYLALLLASVDIALGLQLAHAQTWIVVPIVAAWLVLLSAAVWLQHNFRCVDTYQAIWGPAAHHPGSRVQPVGYGITRRPSNLR